jgi:hypothetical protein
LESSRPSHDKKSSRIKGRSCSCASLAKLQGACVAHHVAHGLAPAVREMSSRRPARRAPRSPASPYLWRRGGVFQFRRRLPKRLVDLGAPEFLSLSLRTNLLPEAMKRAAALIAAKERAEIEIMSQCAVQELTPEAVTLIVREVARHALDHLLRRDAAGGALPDPSSKSEFQRRRPPGGREKRKKDRQTTHPRTGAMPLDGKCYPGPTRRSGWPQFERIGRVPTEHAAFVGAVRAAERPAGDSA